jgi:peptidoglycan/LPS O-acetylase OafA/YrhL
MSDDKASPRARAAMIVAALGFALLFLAMAISTKWSGHGYELDENVPSVWLGAIGTVLALFGCIVAVRELPGRT